MGGTALFFAALLYLFAALGYVNAGRNGMALAFLAYALANFGFMWDLRR